VLAVPALQHHLFRILSSDISRHQGLMLLLGSISAEQRLAAFLLSLSRRYQRLGFAANRFMLRMTREEIGSYLGITVEIVSGMLTRFQREGLIGVHGERYRVEEKRPTPRHGLALTVGGQDRPHRLRLVSKRCATHWSGASVRRTAYGPAGQY
jgi:hypothetical protein